jgi:hypothetical protein
MIEFKNKKNNFRISIKNLKIFEAIMIIIKNKIKDKILKIILKIKKKNLILSYK